ncbi:MAG: hypothetical protein ACYTEU_10855, partial [Planctomycetota bacterium]
VTVLLAVVGVMFLMVSRASEMESGAVVQSKDLDNAVDSVVAKINEVLVKDLFGDNGQIVDNDGGSDESYDVADTDDPWLCDLEPNLIDVAAGTPLDSSDDYCDWDHITDLWSQFTLDGLVLDDLSGTLTWMPQNPVVGFYPQADADGDGVSDSRWVQVPHLTTSRGEPVFAAVRIIDNCAMLNLNAACNFFSGNIGEGIWESDPWYYSQSGFQYNPTGRYLSETNYRFFLRGLDRNLANVKAIELAKDPTPLLFTPKDFHDFLVMNIENPPVSLSLTPFDISDELEIRNRYLLTSLTISKFENEMVAYETFDFGRGQMVGGWSTPLKVKRTPVEDNSDFDKWKRRLGNASSDNMSGSSVAVTGDYYDRRHLCTFYSFDRPLPKGDYPLLDLELDGFANANYVAAGFASATEYKEALLPIFTPKGTVTTNIETPLGLDYFGNAAPYNNIETRQKILHLLYALREYYYDPPTVDKADAALKATQIVANIIDFSDGNFGIDSVAVDDPKDYGPFYDDGTGVTYDYEAQDNLDCTFITKDIIDNMIVEVSAGVLGTAVPLDFGFPTGEIVFGYERQPYISEVYSEWNGELVSPLVTFAIEIVNPYDTPIDLTDYTLEIESVGSFPLNGAPQVPKYDLINKLGRLIIYRGASPAVGAHVETHEIASLPTNITRGNDNTIRLLKSNPSDSGSVELIVDQVLDVDYDDTTDPSLTGTIFKDIDNTDGASSKWSITRDDSEWKFVQAEYNLITENPSTLGNSKTSDPANKGFQLACPDEGYSVSRWHDIEILSLFGNSEITYDPNLVITQQIADAATAEWHFDLFPDSNDYTIGLTDYITPMNRPDYGSLPVRININTAPVHVIAAAIPPTLASLKSAPYNAFTMAQEIVDNRPYTHVGELLGLSSFNHLDSDSDNIGYSPTTGGDDQAIMDDIEERDWILSHLANKFTVRSDVFTAYILVRLGESGPQRRMIGIFDRSQVWEPTDRP